MSDAEQGQDRGDQQGEWDPPHADLERMPPPAGAPVPGIGPRTEDDPWLPHLGRFLGVHLLVSAVGITVVGGLIWFMFMLDRTGRRKRDTLLLFVPLLGIVIATQALWRYTARSVYWSPRSDRPSSPIQGGARTAVIAGGWSLGLIFVALIMAGAFAGVDDGPGWSDRDRDEFRSVLEAEGLDVRTAQCMTNLIALDYPDGPESLPSSDRELEAIGEETFMACS